MRASRRIVTIVFADLVGFTSLSESMDAEDVESIQSAYFTRAHDAIVAHGGLVEKYIGDAVVGSFGVLEAHEDDALHAARAALDLVAGVSEIAVALEAELQVRVGLNTGEVLITQGNEEQPWQITGDVINVAARLQSNAQPGGILVGAETALAVEPVLELESAGDLTMKGKSSPVQGWYVVGPRSSPSRSAALRNGGAILGRESELALLTDSWREAAQQRVGWLVTAPPGVGKTRLVKELRSRISSGGGHVWVTRASPDDSSGYRCVAELLRQSLGPAAEHGSVADVIRSRQFFHDAADLQGDVAAEHTRALLAGERLAADPADLYSSWMAVLDSHVAMAAPVWVIEDLHHAGPDLLAFVRAAATGLEGPGRLLLATSRPTEAVDKMRQGTAMQSLHLDPLASAATVGLVEQALGRGVVPDDVLVAIGDAAGGNPLFVEELLRSWVQAGVLRPVDGGWRFSGEAAADRLPTTVQALYLGQLDGLPDLSRQVVHSGSVPGQTFPSTALSVLDVLDASPALDRLTEFGLLMGPHPGDMDPRSYTYRHGLLREVAYASLPRKERSRLHLRFARWLEASSSHSDDLEESIGKHLAAAYENLPRLAAALEDGLTREELGTDAGDRLERAAERHLASAPARAAMLLERSLRVTARPTPDVALRRTLGLADAQRRAGLLQEALDTFAVAGETARASGSTSGQVVAALGYEDALYASRFSRERWGPVGLGLLAAALEAVDQDDERRGRVMAALGRAQIYGGEVELGLATCAAAVDLARRTDSPVALAQALLATRAGQLDPHHLPDRLKALDVVLTSAGRAGDLETELEAARLQFVDALEAGDVDTSDAALHRAEGLIDRLGRPLYFWYPSMWRAMRSLLDGDPERSERTVREFREQGSRWHYHDVLRVHAVQALELHTQRGDPARAVPLLRTMSEENPLRWASILGVGLARAGELDGAQQALDLLSRHDFAAVSRDLSWTYHIALVAECADTVGDRDAAAVLARLLRPWEDHAVVLGSGALCLGAASHYAGLAARAAGEVDRAASCLRRAVDFNERIRAHWAASRSREELHRTLARQPPDAPLEAM